VAGKYYDVTVVIDSISGSLRVDTVGGTLVAGQVFTTPGTKTFRHGPVASGNNQLGFLPTTTLTAVVSSDSIVGPYDAP